MCLKTYTSEHLMTLGIVKVAVTFSGQSANLDLVVVQQKGPALFGRDWLHHFQLDWQEIKWVRISTGVSDTKPELNEILDQYTTDGVFSDRVGKMKGIQAKLTLMENAQPKFHMP